MTPNITLLPMRSDEWDAVAELIFTSTNAWYEANGKGPIFTGSPSDTRLFCEVYEALDPGCCLVAKCEETGRIAGSCFYHPRETHVSLGIMNVHPDFFGKKVAQKLLDEIIKFAEKRELPLRLVSSAQNLDSFSLYTRKGFVPFISFQDLFLEIPEGGLELNVPGMENVREATADDVPAMVALEKELAGIDRTKDFEYFLENKAGIWKTVVSIDDQGCLQGFLASVNHPGSRMIGPGIARDEEVTLALLARQLDYFRGQTPVFLLPVTAGRAVRQAYAWGARNCEIHFGQVRGALVAPSGIMMPTFMPETG